MNKVVRKEMLAGELPDLLRGEFAADEAVEVMVRSREGNRDASAESIDDILTRMMRIDRTLTAEDLLRRHPPAGVVTCEEAVARIRALREEWD